MKTSAKEEIQPFIHSINLLVTSYVPGAGDTENERQDASLIRAHFLSPPDISAQIYPICILYILLLHAQRRESMLLINF